MTAAKFTASDGMCCQVPRRRIEDGVHVVVTDHMIQKNKPPRDLLGSPREKTYEEQLYRGEVVIHFPEEGLDDGE